MIVTMYYLQPPPDTTAVGSAGANHSFITPLVNTAVTQQGAPILYIGATDTGSLDEGNITLPLPPETLGAGRQDGLQQLITLGETETQQSS